MSQCTSNINSWESTTITSDPLLEDTSSLPSGFIGTYGIDLRPNIDGLNITEISPAKDSGTPLDTIYNGSINSVIRPSGNGWDIGAYEFLLVPVDPAPSPPTNLRVAQ